MAELSYRVLTSLDDRERWDSFVCSSPQRTLFCKSWWLDAAVGTSYDLVVSESAGRIVAGLPLPFTRVGRKKAYIRPPMSTTMGVLLQRDVSTSTSYERRLSREMQLLSGLVASIPANAGFRISLHPTIQNWLPFYWSGFQQTTAYTYVLEGIADTDSLVAGMAHSKRKNLKRAGRLVEVRTDLSSAEFYSHHVETLKKQGKVISYSFEYLDRIVCAARENAQVDLLAAVDASERVHAAIVVIYDEVSAYYIASSIDPDHRQSGSVTLLLLEAMKLASRTTDRFDFEGSMAFGVERSFRRFGARQVPYFVIYKEVGLWRNARTAMERLARKLGIKE